ncbi:trypsin-1-like [Artemia franciscana]
MKVFVATLVCLAAAVSGDNYVLPRLPLSFMLRRGVNLVPESKIVGGDPVNKGDVPWQVSLQREGFFGRSHFCGGSILDADTVLTAAHCTDGQIPSGITVVAGDHVLSTTDGDEQVVGVASISEHPEYNSRTFYNDICVLKLLTSILIGGNVQPVGLPFPNAEVDEGVMATVSGWGTTSAGGSLSDVLLAVNVPVISDADCRGAYGETDVADSMICAGDLANGGIDSCQGDSGGPLYMGSTIIGIVSWGYGCAYAGYPGVYTQVSYYVSFIKSV